MFSITPYLIDQIFVLVGVVVGVVVFFYAAHQGLKQEEAWSEYRAYLKTLRRLHR